MSAENTPQNVPSDIADQAHQAEPPTEAFTSEQLNQRLHQVGLYRELSDDREMQRARLGELEELATLTPEEARLRIDEERQRVRTEGGSSLLLQQYDAYLRDLRTVRREQREYIESQMQESVSEADPRTRREKFLEAVAFSPALAKSALEKLDTTASSRHWDSLHFDNVKLFSPEQIAEASQKPELFQQALVQAVTREPSIILQSERVLRHVASPQQIRTAAESLCESHPDALKDEYSLSKVLPYIDEEARSGFVEKIILTGKDDMSSLRLLAEPDTIKILGIDRVSAFAQKLLVTTPHLPEYTAKLLIERGILPAENVKAQVIELLSNNPTDAFAGNYLNHSELLTPQEKAALKLKVVSALEEQGLKGLDNIRSCDSISEDEKRVIIQKLFDQDPVAAIETNSYTIESFLGPEAVANTLQHLLAEQDIEGMNRRLQGMVIDSELLPTEQRKAAIEQLVVNDPQMFMAHIQYSAGRESVEKLLTPEEFRAATINALNSLQENGGRISLYDLDKHITNLGDIAAQKEFLLQTLHDQPNVSKIAKLKNGTHKYLSSLLTPEELDHEMEFAMERLLTEGAFFWSEDMAEVAEAFGQEYCLKQLDRLKTVAPDKFISVIGAVAYLYSQEELDNNIREVAQSAQSARSLILTLSVTQSWAKYADKELVSKIIRNNADENIDAILYAGENLNRYISENELCDIYRQALVINPALALTSVEQLSKHLDGVSEKGIIEYALQDIDPMSVGGKYLRETLGRLAKTESDTTRQRLILDASQFYKTFHSLKKAGNLELAQSLHQKFNLNKEGERRLVDSMVLLQSLAPGAVTTLYNAESLSDVTKQLTSEVAKQLDIEAPTEGQLDAVERSMGGIANFAIYYSQYKDSPEHTAVLAPMLQSILHENFNVWKYGASFDEVKEKGLIPSSMTAEQYDIWQQEAAVEYEEADTIAAESVRIEMHRALSDDPEALPLESLREISTPNEYHEEISQRMSALGGRIAEIHGELKVLKGQPDQSLAAAQIQELQDELTDTQSTMKDLQLEQDALSLLHISPEEIAAGRVGDNKKGRDIRSIIKRLDKNLARTNAFIPEQLRTVYESFVKQNGSLQLFTIRDTGDPKITLEIGASPVGSCQNFRDGAYNSALLGYTDPNSKVLWATNDRGNPVARSVFRILGDEQGNPVLHVETIYSSDASDGLTRSMYKHAVAKGEAMGIPVVTSARSQNAAGDIETTPLVEGISQQSISGTFSSNGSRAPFVYVDSAGGSQPGGIYTIKNVSQLNIT